MRRKQNFASALGFQKENWGGGGGGVQALTGPFWTSTAFEIEKSVQNP